MPSVPDASSFTRLRKYTAQAVSTTTKKPTASSVPSAGTVAKGTLSSLIKASAEAAKATPSATVLAISAKKGNTSKRG